MQIRIRPYYRLLRASVALLTLWLASSYLCFASHYRIYLIGGQSNAAGRGDASELTAPLDSPQSDVAFYWHKTLETTNGNLTQDTWIDLQPGAGQGKNRPSGHAVEFGPEIIFGRTMADSNPRVNIAIIKYAHGGSNLHTEWAPTGERYLTFLSTVKEALTTLKEAGHSYEFGGMLWIQGEADARPRTSTQYEANLTHLIQRIRTEVFHESEGSYTPPIIISGLSDSQYSDITTPGTGAYNVRQAQEAVASRGRQTGFVNTDGFGVYPDRNNIHFNAAGQLAIGLNCAHKMLELEALDPDRDGVLSPVETTR